ncbi:MAG: VOC family protein [Pseudomonadota bacterium]
MSAQKSLDHFVLAVSDLEASAQSYRRLGFNVRPIARHSHLGSANCVIHFPTTYLEIAFLSASPVGADYMSRIELGDGLAHVSLTSDDLKAEQEVLRDNGYEPGEIYSASRKIVTPDGGEAETASNFFYCWREDNKYLSLFFSEHLKPETIFIPAFEDHANTAIGVKRLVYMSERPDHDVHYFSSFFRSKPIQENDDGFVMRGTRGELTEVLSVGAARQRYGESLVAASPAPLEGFGIAMHYGVKDRNACARVLDEAGVNHRMLGDSLMVPAADACGCVVVFESA